jgi:hypothetical protein
MEEMTKLRNVITKDVALFVDHFQRSKENVQVTATPPTTRQAFSAQSPSTTRVKRTDEWEILTHPYPSCNPAVR